MQGDHDEIKIFLEIRLIPSRIDQKLKRKKGKIHAFKEGIRPEIVAIGSGRGHCLKALWDRFLGPRMPLQFRNKIDFNFASTRAPIVARSGHDQAMIERRSWTWISVGRRLLRLG